MVYFNRGLAKQAKENPGKRSPISRIQSKINPKVAEGY
jgi:hypothetical protein